MMTTIAGPEIILRSDAIARGLVRYFTGKPCKHGHTEQRFSSTGQCAACVDAWKVQHGVKTERAKSGAARRNKRWGDKNKARKAAAGERWRQSNPDAVRAHVSNRRALRFKATPPWFGELDEFVVLESADLAAKREAATGFAWQVDHMVPIKAKAATGLHCAANIQVIPAAINAAKGNKMQLTEPREWLRIL